MSTNFVPTGVGLGLRSSFSRRVAQGEAKGRVAFLEVPPENHLQRGGRWPAYLAQAAEFHPVLTHGLTMSLGGEAPLDGEYLERVGSFCQRFGTPWHSDHLCFASDGGDRLHDLLPIPFTYGGAKRVAARIKQASLALKREMLIENVSQYVRMGEAEMSEAEFVTEVLTRADCGLLLDVNNIFVNSRNFDFDPYTWLAKIPLERVRQLHVAGHERWEKYGMWVDTHSAEVLPEVHDMMAWVIERTGPLPVLLERDGNIPPLEDLLDEVASLQARYDAALEAGGHV
jgi:uncharacterized protein (UPF0276 family)